MSTNGTSVGGALVIQASGMVSVQAHCTSDEALVLIEARAAETHRTLVEISAGGLNRSIAFTLRERHT
jgi:hypothetical protein